jgi:translocation and assembly module TamB
LVLSQADLVMEGSLVPWITVAASTGGDGITSTVTVEGPADNPEVRFTSSPDLPQEEVLAQLLFGRGLDTISALQAAQLANAVAVLAGRGGVGLVGNLRRSFGLDDLDVTTAEDGSAALKAGKYISENVYTEIEVDQDGKSQINLNLDLREGVTVKGRVDADGQTGIGVFLERDY